MRDVPSTFSRLLQITITKRCELMHLLIHTIGPNDPVIVLPSIRRALEDDFRNAQASAKNISGVATNADNANASDGLGAGSADLISAAMARPFGTLIVSHPSGKPTPLCDVRADYV